MQVSLKHRFQLDGSQRERKRKIDCRCCGGRKTFTRYKDYETGEYIDDTVGFCDRVNKCNYHLKPKEWFAANPNTRPALSTGWSSPLEPQDKPLVHIPVEEMKKTLNGYESNSFIKALLAYFHAQTVQKAIEEYFIGSTDPLTGNDRAVVFWFVDKDRNVRAGQVKQFDKNCKTVRVTVGDHDLKAWWIHKQIKKRHWKEGKDAPQWLKDYESSEKITCLYGEHLLAKYPTKPVGLVEAPKTAVIASMMYPQYVWLATTSLSYLTRERCKVLRGRTVVLFPDCGVPNKRTGQTCLDDWRERVEDFKDIALFTFSTLLEDHSTPEQKEMGLDLADLVLQELSRPPINISVDDIESMPVEVRTGPDFGRMILLTVIMKDGRMYDVLYDQNGELVTSHPQLKPLSEFFEKSFVPGTIAGDPCLINVN